MMGALEGVKVLDLARGGPGPYCTMVLGDLGAEVLQVVEPAGGRRARQREGHDPDAERQERRSAAFNVATRNKRSVALDLKHPAARQVLYRLSEETDVFIETLRPGVMERLEMDYERLRRINPRLIYCSLTGYGQDGPYRDLAGHDLNFNAVAGALVVGLGEEGGAAPVNLVGLFPSRALIAVVGVLAAVIARERTGRGQYVDVSLTDGALYLLARVLSDYLSRGTMPKGEGPDLLGRARPFYAVYRAQDGRYLSLGAGEPHLVDNLMRALGKEEWVGRSDDEGLYPQMFAFLQDTFRSRPRDEWFEELRRWDVAVAKVNTMAEVVDDPQLRHREMVVEAGSFEGETVRQVGIGVKLSETPGAIRSIGTLPGQHTVEVLAGLGYSQGEILRMREQGAIG